MARPTTKPRVPALEPERVALEFVLTVQRQLQAISPLLYPITGAMIEPTEADLKRTALYRDLVRLAKDVVRGEPPATPHLSRLLIQLEPLLRGPFHEQSLRAVLETIDPDEEVNPVKLLLAAALIRQQLAEGTHAITSSQLAIVAGVTRRHVGAEIRDGRLEAEIAGRRGTAGAALIRPDEARRWLQERGV